MAEKTKVRLAQWLAKAPAFVIVTSDAADDYIHFLKTLSGVSSSNLSIQSTWQQALDKLFDVQIHHRLTKNTIIEARVIADGDYDFPDYVNIFLVGKNNEAFERFAAAQMLMHPRHTTVVKAPHIESLALNGVLPFLVETKWSSWIHQEGRYFNSLTEATLNIYGF